MTKEQELLGALAQMLVDKFHAEYPEGTQPGDCTRLAMGYLNLLHEFETAQPEGTRFKAVGWYDRIHDRAKWEPGMQPPHGALLFRPDNSHDDERTKALYDALEAVKGEHLEEPQTDDDRVYDQAVTDCECAIERILFRPTPQKGEG